MESVSLVIPARNEASVLRACLDSAQLLLRRGEVAEVLVVDDGSTDETPAIIRSYDGVTYLAGPGRGAGAARNLGVSRATSPLIWFVDADCVIDPQALSRLRPHLGAAEVAGVSGSYGNMRDDVLLSCLIHEEIVQRHLRMEGDVNFLATFNVLYRRSALQAVGGFDDRFVKGQDAELSFRVRKAGYRLRFDRSSIVYHFHEDSLRRYLRVQRSQGYYRALMYWAHPEKMSGDSYSNLWDHVQPPLALLTLAGPLGLACAPLLWAAPWPLACSLVRRTGDRRQWAHVPFSVIRAYARGLGLAEGALSLLWDRYRNS